MRTVVPIEADYTASDNLLKGFNAVIQTLPPGLEAPVVRRPATAGFLLRVARMSPSASKADA